MSAPQGLRSRSGSRGRGNPRAGFRTRAAAHGGRERQPVKRASTNPTTRESSHHLKSPPDQNLHHNKSSRSPSSLSSAFQSHAGNTPKPSSESWRNPSVEDSRTYKQRMSDLYQTVRIPPYNYSHEDIHSDIWPFRRAYSSSKIEKKNGRMQSRMAFLQTRTSQLRWLMPSHQWGPAKICALNMSESRELYNSWSMEARRYGKGKVNSRIGKIVLILA